VDPRAGLDDVKKVTFISVPLLWKFRVRAVDIATGYGLGGREVGVQVPETKLIPWL
jgi:hypothetical protein